MECHYLISERTYNELVNFKAKYLQLKSKAQGKDEDQIGHGAERDKDEQGKGNDKCKCPKLGPSTYTEPVYNKLMKADNKSGLANLTTNPKSIEIRGSEVSLPVGSTSDIFRDNLLSGIAKKYEYRAKKIVGIIIDNCKEENGYYIIQNTKYSQSHLKTLLKSILHNNKLFLQGRDNFCNFLKLHGLGFNIKRNRKTKTEETVRPDVAKALNAPAKDWYCIADLRVPTEVGAVQASNADNISQPI